jgi:hypothetical protein
MNCTILQSRCETLSLLSPEDRVENGGVIRQHTDNDLAFEEASEFQCGTETEPNEGAHLIRSTDISSDSTSRRCKVRGHRRSHMAEANKSDCALPR